MSSHIIITSGTSNAQSATKLSRPGITWQTTSGRCIFYHGILKPGNGSIFRFRPLFLPPHRCKIIIHTTYCKASNENYSLIIPTLYNQTKVSQFQCEHKNNITSLCAGNTLASVHTAAQFVVTVSATRCRYWLTSAVTRVSAPTVARFAGKPSGNRPP